MKGSDRLRRLASYALFAAFAIAAISCNEAHPNSTLTPHSDFGREIDFLWDRLLLLGTIVFVLVEAVLVFVICIAVVTGRFLLSFSKRIA